MLIASDSWTATHNEFDRSSGTISRVGGSKLESNAGMAKGTQCEQG